MNSPLRFDARCLSPHKWQTRDYPVSNNPSASTPTQPDNTSATVWAMTTRLTLPARQFGELDDAANLAVQTGNLGSQVSHGALQFRPATFALPLQNLKCCAYGRERRQQFVSYGGDERGLQPIALANNSSSSAISTVRCGVSLCDLCSVIHYQSFVVIFAVWTPHLPGHSSANGSQMIKVLPAPSWLSTMIRPPCRSTISLAIASPRPLPGRPLCRGFSPR